MRAFCGFATRVALLLCLASPAAPQAVIDVPLAANDIVYDAVGGKLFASVTGSGVAVIDPSNGAIGRYIAVGSGPNQLAVSDDGQFLYVGLDGEHAVQRVTLATFTPDLQFSLGENTAADIVVMPGAPHTTAVWRFGESNDVAIYDDDVRRIFTLPTSFTGTLLPGSGQRLYGSTFVSFVRMTVTASGVVADGETSGFNRAAHVSATDGLLYFAGGGGTSEPTRGGSVVEPESFKVLATVMPAWNEYIEFLVKDRAADRIYAFGPTIQAYETNTFTRQWSALTIEVGDSGYPTSVASTGAGRVAFASRQKITLASFADTELLSLSFSGNGNGRVSIAGARSYCELACASPISSGRSIALLATADYGSTFVGWHGDPDCADGFVTMSTARSCVAEFTQPAGLGTRLHVPSNDLAYSAATGRFYASVPGWAGPGGNSIAVIDPSTATVEQSVWVGSEPGKLALSNDGRALYVGLNGVGQVRRVDLQPFTPQPAFSVSGCEGPCNLEALSVSPVDPDSVAIAVTSHGIWPNALAAVYSRGVRRPSTIEFVAAPPFDLAFSETAERLYRFGVANELQRLAVGEGGLTALDSVHRDLGAGISVRGNRVYGASGQTLDADLLELVGTFSGDATVRPALVDDTVWLVGFSTWSRRINAFDSAQFSLRRSMVAATSAAVLTLAASREHVAYGDGRVLYLVGLSDSHRLTIGKSGTGNGLIGSQPAGIDCGDWCTNLYPADATVTLTVSPNPGTRFAGWAGDADCNDGVVTMAADRTCRAVFVQTASGQGLQLPLRVNDLAYSATTGLLYASVPGSNPSVGNSVIALDPATGAMSGSTWVGSEPTQLAMSSDGAVLYVGLDGAAAVRRVDLTGTSMSPGPDFRLGLDPWSGSVRRAAELAVVPGDSNSVVVSQVGGAAPGLTLFSGGVARPRVAPQANSGITFSDSPTSMFSSGEGKVFRIEVGPDGLTPDASPLITFPYATGRIRFDSGRIYEDRGRVVDPLTGTLVASLPSVGFGSAVAPDVAHAIVYFVTADPAVLRFDAQTFALIDGRPQAGPPDYAKRVVVAGNGRLGYVDGDGQPVLYASASALSYELFLDSTFAPSVTLAVTPTDMFGQASGVTPLTRNYSPGTSVTITAPATVGDKTFDQWLDGRGFYVSQERTLVASMTSPRSYAAAYHGPKPTVTSVEPAFGSAAGGTSLVIRGTGFQSGANVNIGNTATSVAVVDATTITCVTPARFPGTVGVGVVNPDHQAGSGGAFTYYGPPTLSGVAPPSAPPAGGTQMTVSGSQFVPGHTSLTIAGVEALDVTVGFGWGSSGPVLTALSPPGPAGPAVVTVTTPFGTASASSAFRYAEPPVITSITPDRGPIWGNTTVTITGSHFEAGATVTFGHVAVTVLSTTADEIQVTAPSADAGAVDVTVTNPGGQSATLVGGYAYYGFRRYFAEGAATSMFDCYFALANPNPTVAATVTLHFLRNDSQTFDYTVQVPAMSQRTVKAKDVPGLTPALGFSTIVESDLEVIADRTMTWDATGYGSHAETSIKAPAPTWYLAEGATHSGLQLYYCLENPNPGPVDVTVSYLRPAPNAPIDITYAGIPGGSRKTIFVNGEDPRLASVNVSAVITATGGSIIVERALYMNNGGRSFNAGHVSAGVTAPATDWFLAEGATVYTFDMYILLANPSDTAGTAEITYMLQDGRTLVKNYPVGAHSRETVWVNGERDDANPAFTLKGVSLSAKISASVPIIVERAMWWSANAGAPWHEAHDAVGTTETGTSWAVADGEQGGARGTDTYVLVANTSPFPARVRVTVLGADGSTPSAERVVAPNGRTTFWTGGTAVTADTPFGGMLTGKRFGALVESVATDQGTAQIVVERAMYSNANGMAWAAGTDVVATKLK